MPRRKVGPGAARRAGRAPAIAIAPPAETAQVDEDSAFAGLRYLVEGEGDYERGFVEALLQFPRGEWSGLEEAALEWTYILRSRQRWVSAGTVFDDHIERATETLRAFAVPPGEIQRMARAAHIEVRMVAGAEDDGGWSVRVFPWEYVIAAATRPYRHGNVITITRALEVERAAVLPLERKAQRPKDGELRVLYVESAPGEIGRQYDFQGERELMDIYLMGGTGTKGLLRLYAPTREALSDAVVAHRPHIVHLCGMDAHEAEIQKRWLARDARARDTTLQPRTGPVSESADVTEQRDGYILSDALGKPVAAGPIALAHGLTGKKTWFPWLVCMNVENSASRMAPRAVQWGCSAAIGFQDAFDSGLAKIFFGTLYASLRGDWNLSLAFREAWQAVRQRPGNLIGTGVVLWTDVAQLTKEPAPRARRAPGAVKRAVLWSHADRVSMEWLRSRVRVRVKPKGAINYSLLHNDDTLFDEFSLKPAPDTRVREVSVRVVLCAGVESAEYACSIDLEGRPVDLRRQIRVSLGADLIRSVHEAINTTWLVEITWGRHVLLRETYPVRLLPIDQWRDAASSRSWLPSFVFPRDRAVCELIAKASNYVRVLRDDPAAGFEGYQCLPDKERLDPHDALEVDLQVQAIWSAILYEWRLTYINPPPTYSTELDSQRLRTPSMIERDRYGTCIDLALLVAAALELVDIRPVIFLLEGHAFPGYWRADTFHERFSQAWPEPETIREITAIDRESNGMGGTQRYPWAVGRAMVREILLEIRAGRLVPLETVRLTENCGFAEAIEVGRRNLADPDEFEFLIDIAIARQHDITPLPLLGEGR